TATTATASSHPAETPRATASERVKGGGGRMVAPFPHQRIRLSISDRVAPRPLSLDVEPGLSRTKRPRFARSGHSRRGRGTQPGECGQPEGWLSFSSRPCRVLMTEVAMPTYEYRCASCGQHIEVVQSFSDEPLKECGVCGGP